MGTTRGQRVHYWLPLALSVVLHGVLVTLLWAMSETSHARSVPAAIVSWSADRATLMEVASTRLDDPSRPSEAEEQSFPIALKESTTTPADQSKAMAPQVEPIGNTELGSPVSAAQPLHPPSAAGTTGTRPAGAGAGTGGPAFCDVPIRGLRVVYVIDRSTSMGEDGGLERAKGAVRASLHQLPPEASFQLIFYDRHPEPLPLPGAPDLCSATDEHKQLALALLEREQAEGGTDHFPALRLALALHPDVICLLTDADDLRPEQIKAITALNHGKAIINTFELSLAHRGHAEMPLQQLARQNRGEYRAIGRGG